MNSVKFTVSKFPIECLLEVDEFTPSSVIGSFEHTKISKSMHIFCFSRSIFRIDKSIGWLVKLFIFVSSLQKTFSQDSP